MDFQFSAETGCKFEISSCLFEFRFKLCSEANIKFSMRNFAKYFTFSDIQMSNLFVILPRLYLTDFKLNYIF